jgi:hypothetical protein
VVTLADGYHVTTKLKLERNSIAYMRYLSTCHTIDNILMLPDALHNFPITQRNYLKTILPVTT